MAALRSDIAGWFDRGVKQGATHMLVVCDTYDYTDYPVFVSPSEDVHEVEKRYLRGENMTRLMEVYNLRMDKETQMNEYRAFNY